jgi:hypothetical protein
MKVKPYAFLSLELNGDEWSAHASALSILVKKSLVATEYKVGCGKEKSPSSVRN